MEGSIIIAIVLALLGILYTWDASRRTNKVIENEDRRAKELIERMNQRAEQSHRESKEFIEQSRRESEELIERTHREIEQHFNETIKFISMLISAEGERTRELIRIQKK